MKLQFKKIFIFTTLLASSLSMIATHYINRTGKNIIVTNFTAQQRAEKGLHKKGSNQSQIFKTVYFIEIENDGQADLDNRQEDEIWITSPDLKTDKRILFPTNNSFNYVVEMSNHPNMFEQFDINHAGDIETKKSKQPKKPKQPKKYKSQQNSKG